MYIKRKHIGTAITVTILLLSAIAMWIYRSYGNQSGSDLNELAEDAKLHIKEGNIDSALNCYSIITAMDVSENTDLQKIKATSLNNMGYIFLHHKHDPLTAYPFFLHAASIADRHSPSSQFF